MASIFTLKSHSYNTRYMYITCEQVMDVETNTSTVNWTLHVVGGTANYITTGPTTVKIGGQQVYYAGISYWNVKQFPAAKGSVSGTTTINHNEEGKAAVEVSITTAIYDGVLRTSKDTWTLDDIPRGARFTAAPDFTDEDDPLITFTNQAGGSVRACISTDNVNDNICAWRPVSGSEYQFTLTQEEQEKIWDATVAAGSPSMTLYFRLETTLGDYVGYTSKPVICSIKNPDPIITLTVQDINNFTSWLTGDPNKIIPTFSNVEYFLEATPMKNAEITNYYITDGGQLQTTENSGTIQGIVVETFTYAARDSRNIRVEGQKKMEVVPYVPVSCSQTSSIRMSGETTARATIKITGNYFNQSFGQVYNQLRVMINYGNGWIDINEQPTFNGNRYELTYTTPDVPYDQDFVFQIDVSDQLTSARTTEHTLQIIPLFDWSKTDFNFNIPISIKGQQMKDFVIETGTSGIWTYRKWNSGIAECWGTIAATSHSITTAWGAIYTKDNAIPQQNYPFQFVADPVVSMTLHNPTGNCWAFTGTPGGVSKSPAFGLARGASGSATVGARIMAIGRWR